MRPPEITYRFSVPSDTAGPTLELYTRNLLVSASAASVTTPLNGPAKDRTLVLTNVSVQAVPGATQSADRMRISITTPGGAGVDLATFNPTAVADIRRDLNWTGEVMIGGAGMDNQIIEANCVFSAGVAANILVINVCGYVIPRGNIAPF